MNILILNGSPRKRGNTAAMIAAFTRGALSAGHTVERADVCSMNIHGCHACEYCHRQEERKCVQKDDMDRIYDLLERSQMLVLASPIYYHNISGQLKCAIDRFYVTSDQKKIGNVSKVRMLLSSGDKDMYDGAIFSYRGDFLDYLSLEDMGVVTAFGEVEKQPELLEKIEKLGRSLK
ncbi:MAG: flavodoxin family protein [Oscillospiraceae bacterium]|nr:flavodoxin family protein [Oscillospiraceae bacterium]